ncbi:hypothetical protein ANN_14647 [Periplaneta americana]|uniref:Uncharacterized protein n=1 Tax=Periplaneta americana TaxID=6978 RepID=A0ABQ8SWW7_PERAM|nr:hypothetical protein ANN_14647 [Periplaneta americana]
MRLRNEDLRSQTHLKDAAETADKLKKKWAGHVMRLNENRWTHILTTWDSRIGKRNAGRQKTRWADELRSRFGHLWSSVVRPSPTAAIMDLNRIPSTTHGHEFHNGLSRVVMVRKTEQRTFASGKTGEVMATPLTCRYSPRLYYDHTEGGLLIAWWLGSRLGKIRDGHTAMLDA